MTDNHAQAQDIESEPLLGERKYCFELSQSIFKPRGNWCCSTNIHIHRMRQSRQRQSRQSRSRHRRVVTDDVLHLRRL